jgi:hypothetical protein
MGLERGRLSAEKLMKLMKAMLLVKHVRQDKVAVEVAPKVWLGSIGAAYNKEFLQVDLHLLPPAAINRCTLDRAFDSESRAPRPTASPACSALEPHSRSRTRTSSRELPPSSSSSSSSSSTAFFSPLWRPSSAGQHV